MVDPTHPGAPGKHPRPDLPQATWDAIAAAVQECLDTSTGGSPGFVAIARACRAARKAGRIPGCSNQQLAAALAYLAGAGQLGTADTSPATAPKNDPLRVHINRFLDVVYDEQAGRARVLVGGKPFLHCSFVVASIDPKNDNNQDIDSIDDLATSLAHDARVLEGPDVRKWLTPAEEVLAHASNLQAWVENDYDTRLLHSNIAFPLLKELAKAGDEKAKRALDAEIEARLREGSTATRITILEACADIIHDPGLIKILLNDDYYSAREMARILHDRAMAGDKMAIDQLISAVQDRVFGKSFGSRLELLDCARDFITDHSLINQLLQDEDTMTTAIVILNNLASKGDAIAAHTLDQNIRLWIKKGSYQVRRCTLHVCRHRIVDVGLIKELLHDEDIWQDALKLLNRRADRGDIDAIRVLQAEITTCIKERNYSFLRKIISTCRTCIQDQDMIEILLDDEHTSDIMAEILYYRARDGDKAAIDLLLSALRVHVLDRNSSAHYMILHNAQHFITDHGLIQQLLQDDKAKTTAIQILRDLASKGDAVAARTLDDNIENWIENGSLDFRRTVFHICKDRIMDLRLIQMFIRDDRTKREALELIKLRADQGNDDAARLLDAIITDQIGKGTYDAIWGILSLCPDMLWNKGLLDSFIKKDVWFHYLMSFLQEQARKGDERAATKFKEIIEAMIPEFFTGGDYLHMIRALPRTKMEFIITILPEDRLAPLLTIANTDSDKDVEIRLNIANLKSIPHDVMVRLARDRQSQENIAARYEIPEDILSILVNEEASHLTSEALFLSEHSERTWYYMLHQSYPPFRGDTRFWIVLSHLSDSEDPSIRLEVASQPELTVDIAERLEDDPDLRVSAVIRARWERDWNERSKE